MGSFVAANGVDPLASDALALEVDCPACQAPRGRRCAMLGDHPDAHNGGQVHPARSKLRLSAAYLLAQMIRARVPGWAESSDAAGHWRFTDPDEDYAWRGHPRYVDIDGRERSRVLVAPQMAGTHVGPSLLGFAAGLSVFVVLPETVDKSDLRAAIDAVVAIGALPDVDGMTR